MLCFEMYLNMYKIKLMKEKNFCRKLSTKGNDDGSFGQRERLNEEVEVVQEGREGGGEVEGQDKQC